MKFLLIIAALLFGTASTNIPEPVIQEVQENVQTFMTTEDDKDATYIYLSSKGMGYEEEGLVVEKIFKDNKVAGNYVIKWVPFGDTNEVPEYTYEFIIK